MNWEKGISLERIDWQKECLSQENLLYHQFQTDSSTCGYLNSVSPAEYDLLIDSVFYNELFKLMHSFKK